MRRGFRLAAIGALAAALTLACAWRPAAAQSRAHVYLFRGLADVFSTGMDTLADELNKRGISASSHSHTEWKSIANQLVADYKAKKGGPIILIGHSLGADAVMEMADYLGDRGVPVALAVPFDATQSFAASGNVGRVLNLTQRDYAYMRGGPGFRGSLSNVDLSSDPSIDHLNIDKSPRLHARVIAEVVAVVGGRNLAAPAGALPAATRTTAPDRTNGGAVAARPADSNANGTPIIARPEGHGAAINSAAPATPPPQHPVAAPQPVNPLQIPD